MKKFLSLIVFFLFVSVFAACDKHESESDWDYTPIAVCFEVLDSEGNNLYESSTADNWLGQSASCTFDGQSYLYPFNTADPDAVRFALAEYASGSGSPLTVICFGDLDGSKDYDSDLFVSWPDGSTDRVKIYNKVEQTGTGAPKITRSMKLNGTECKELITLRK